MICDLDTIVREVKWARTFNRTIAFTNGCFDIIHSGHIKSLHLAASHADVLIVGVDNDKSVRALKGSARPINSLANRLLVVSAIRCVTFCFSFGPGELAGALERIRPDVLVKGEEYRGKEVAGAQWAKKIVYSPRIDSTTRIAACMS